MLVLSKVVRARVLARAVAKKISTDGRLNPTLNTIHNL
jgi:hypothetical protein